MSDLTPGTICYLTHLGLLATVIAPVGNEPGWFCCRCDWLEAPSMMLISGENLKPVAKLNTDQLTELLAKIEAEQNSLR